MDCTECDARRLYDSDQLQGLRWNGSGLRFDEPIRHHNGGSRAAFSADEPNAGFPEQHDCLVGQIRQRHASCKRLCSLLKWRCIHAPTIGSYERFHNRRGTRHKLKSGVRDDFFRNIRGFHRRRFHHSSEYGRCVHVPGTFVVGCTVSRRGVSRGMGFANIDRLRQHFVD